MRRAEIGGPLSPGRRYFQERAVPRRRAGRGETAGEAAWGLCCRRRGPLAGNLPASEPWGTPGRSRRWLLFSRRAQGITHQHQEDLEPGCLIVAQAGPRAVEVAISVALNRRVNGPPFGGALGKTG
jgi:hypothetical protein